MSKSGRRTWFQPGKNKSTERLDIVLAEETQPDSDDRMASRSTSKPVSGIGPPGSMAATGRTSTSYTDEKRQESGEGDSVSENFFANSLVKKQDGESTGRSTSPADSSRKSWDVYIHTGVNNDTKAVRNIIKSWREKEQRTLEHMKDSHHKQGYSSLERPSTLAKGRSKKLSSSIDELESIFDNMTDKSFDSLDSGENQEAKYSRAGYFKACATPLVNRKVRKTVTFKEEGQRDGNRGKPGQRRVQSPGVQMLFGSKSESNIWESETEGQNIDDSNVEQSSTPFKNILDHWRTNQKPFKYHTFDRSMSPVVLKDVNSNKVNVKDKDLPKPIKFDDFLSASSPVPQDKEETFNLPVNEPEIKHGASTTEEEVELGNIKIKERISAFESNKKKADGRQTKAKQTATDKQKSHVSGSASGKPKVVVQNIMTSKTAAQSKDTTVPRKSVTDMFRSKQTNHRSESPGPIQSMKNKTAMDRSSSLTNLSQRSKSPAPKQRIETKMIETQNGNLSHLLPKSVQGSNKSDTKQAKGISGKSKDHNQPSNAIQDVTKSISKTSTSKVKSEKSKSAQAKQQTKESNSTNPSAATGSKNSRMDMTALSPTPYKKPEKFTFSSVGKKTTTPFSNKTEKNHSNNLAKSKNAKLNLSVPDLSSKSINSEHGQGKGSSSKRVVPCVAFGKSQPLPYKQTSPERSRGRLRTAWPPLDSSTKDEAKEKDTAKTPKEVSPLKSVQSTVSNSGRDDVHPKSNIDIDDSRSDDGKAFQRAYRRRERSQSPGRSQWSTRLSLGQRSRQSFSELGKSLKRSLTPSMENLLLDEDIDYNKPSPDPVVKLSGRLYRGVSEPNLFSQLDFMDKDSSKDTIDTFDKARSSFSSGYESQISDKDHHSVIDESTDTNEHVKKPNKSGKKSRDYRRRTVSGDSFKEFAKLSADTSPSGKCVSDRFLKLTGMGELPKRETLDDLMNKPLPSRKVKRSSSLRDFRSVKGLELENVDLDWRREFSTGSPLQTQEDPVKIIRDDENGLVGFVFNV